MIDQVNPAKQARLPATKKQYFLFDGGEIALSFPPEKLVDFREMWKAGISVKNIAKQLKVKEIEVVLMVLDQSYKKYIEQRDSGLDGL